MNPPDHQQPSAYEQASPESSHRPQAITIPKNKSASNLLAQGSDSIAADVPLPRARLSVDAGTEAYDNLTRYVILHSLYTCGMGGMGKGEVQ